MSLEQPGAPAPSETGGTATFRAGVEPAEATAGAPAEAPRAAPPAAAPPARRRLLDDPDPDAPKAPRKPRVRARKVRRIVRHIEPWSVLKISVLFFLSVFLIICVASAVLWNAARSAGAIDDVESLINSLAVFGNCEDIDGEPGAAPPTTASTIAGDADQLAPTGATSSTVPVEAEPETSTLPDEDGKCAEGQRLVGGFKFEDQRIFQAFGLGGIVLVLAGSATTVVMALLFNLISDLTGGVRVTVLEEEPVKPRTGSPAPGARD